MNSEPDIQSSPRFDVVGLGAVVVDEQLFVDRVPSEDEKEKATEIRHQIGGPVPTALATLRRFGRSCHFIGPWGDDVFGNLIEKDLRQEGISRSSNCQISAASTGRAHVWTSNSNGSRTIVSLHCSWDGFRFSQADRQALAECRILHLDGTGGGFALQAAKIVREAGGKVVMDTGSPKEATAELISLCDVVSFPERFVQQFYGRKNVKSALDEIRQSGPEMVVCTRGIHGAVVTTDRSTNEIPAFPVETVDSTGAGDVFCGGVIAGLLHGLDEFGAVRTGAAAAAIKCQGIGNRSALPGPEQIERLLSSTA